MADSEKFIPFLKKVEGGFSSSKADSAHNNALADGSGIHTNAGMQHATFERLSGKLGYEPTDENFRQMTTNGIWEKIYKTYWNEIKGDNIHNQAVAESMLDFHFNGGFKKREVMEQVQKLVGTKPDGKFGSGTVNAINNSNPAFVVKGIHEIRLNYLQERKDWKNNGEGWQARLDDLKKRLEEELKKSGEDEIPLTLDFQLLLQSIELKINDLLKNINNAGADVQGMQGEKGPVAGNQSVKTAVQVPTEKNEFQLP